VISESAKIDETATVGHNTRIGNNVTIGKDVRIGHHAFIGHNVVIRSGCHIGRHVVIGHGTVIEQDCFVGDYARVQALVYLARGTKVARKVFIGPMVCTTNDRRILSHGRGNFVPNAPVIEFGARIGARALIMPGVRIKKNALIGAGAIIDNDAHEGQVWMGTKGKRTGAVPEEEILNEQG
jgi:UDP-3-O-[3-hydroxymyristoyl] glucosamine N-acyltransferase